MERKRERETKADAYCARDKARRTGRGNLEDEVAIAVVYLQDTSITGAVLLWRAGVSGGPILCLTRNSCEKFLYRA